MVNVNYPASMDKHLISFTCWPMAYKQVTANIYKAEDRGGKRYIAACGKIYIPRQINKF